jgi:hypothetical protein
MKLAGIPLLLVPFAVYNAIAFAPAANLPTLKWTDPLITVRMISGEPVSINAATVLIAASMLLLFGEMVKWTRLGTRPAIGHLLSLVLLVAMVVEFLFVKQAATATFFLLIMLCFVDLVSGFAVAMGAARRQAVTLESDPAVAA